MAEQAFKKGDTVWVYARIFDSEQEKWSETNPLVGGPNTKLWGVVLRKKKDGWYDIKFELDKKSSIISLQHLNAVYEGLRCRSDGKVVDSRDIEEVRDEVSEESEHESGRDDASSEEEEEIELDRNVEIDWEFEKLVNDAAPANKLYSHVNPSLRTAQREVQGAHDVLWHMWQRFFAENYAREIIVECTNQHAVGDQEWKEPLTLDEFYTYLGILLYMSVVQLSDDRRVYWSLSQYDAGVFSSPQLGQYMPRRRFELITKHLTLGDNGDPTDKLRYYREWLNAVRDQFKALRHFSDGYKDVSHNQVRMELTNMMLLRMAERESATQRAKRQATAIAADHTVARYSKQNGQLRCAICGTKTVYVCAYCDSTRGICKPGKMLTDGTPSQCWTEHLKDGKLPKPKRTRT